MIKLISITPNAEEVMAYCARVSATKERQDSGDLKLLSYCIKHKHWSVFEMANACIEVTTSRAIGRQLLRHRSINFQELSQRYQDVTTQDDMFVKVEPRMQDKKNRQNSTDDLDYVDTAWFEYKLDDLNMYQQTAYKEALERGIAKESARFLLGENAVSRMFMNGTVRSWIHFLEVRAFGEGVQLECREIALEIYELLKLELPTVFRALDFEGEVKK